MLKQRILTALVLIPFLIWALFAWPQPAFAVFLGVFILVGAWEWTALCGLQRLSARIFYLALVAVAGGILIATPSATLPLMAVAVLWWAWSFIELVYYPDVRQGFLASQPGKLLSGFVLLLPAWIAPLVLRAHTSQGEWLVLFLLLIVWGADTGAYFAGRRFGKTKLAPSISPGKTWEGVAGALFGASIYVVLVWSFSPYFSQRGLLPGLLLASWWWVGLAVIGDLFESAIKRQAGVKDSGALLPGHGGLLDRIDALTSTLPLAALVILLQHLG